jgi:UDP-N-acetyl-D-galactosamine dehydrogenase
MGAYVVSRVIKLMMHRNLMSRDSRVLILGLTFKENCPDLRNTRVVDIVSELTDYGIAVDVHDPWVDPDEAQSEYGIDLIGEPQPGSYDAVILAVAHRQFQDMGIDRIRALGKPNAVLFDVKHAFPASQVDGRL